MFYEEETSPLPSWWRRPDQHLARKALSAIAGFVAMMTNRARLRHGTPFGADALFGEDMHPFFQRVQAVPDHACPKPHCAELVLLPQGRSLVFSPQENVRQKKRKQEIEERKAFCSEQTVNFEPKSKRYLNQKVFIHCLSSASFLSMLRRREA